LWEGVKWINLTQDRDQWRGLTTTMNLRDFFTEWLSA